MRPHLADLVTAASVVVIAVSLAAGVILYTFRNRPTVRDLCGIDAIRAELGTDDQAAFDAEVDIALAICNATTEDFRRWTTERPVEPVRSTR